MKVSNAVECIARVVGMVSLCALTLTACAAPMSEEDEEVGATSEGLTLSTSSKVAVLFPGASGGPLACGGHTASFNMADQSAFGYRLHVDGADAPLQASCGFVLVQSYATALACLVDPVTGVSTLHAVNTIEYWFQLQESAPPFFACENASPIQPAHYTPDRSSLLATARTIGENRFLVTNTGIWSFGKSTASPYGSILLRNGHGTGALGIYNGAVDTTAKGLEVANKGRLYATIDTGAWYDWEQPQGWYGAFAWVPTSAPPSPLRLF